MVDGDALMKSMYDELRRLANRHLQRNPNQSLQPTELVNMAYLRLARQIDKQWESRTEYFRAAAHVMRLALVDHIRAMKAAKRPPKEGRVDIMVTLPERKAPVAADDVLALHDALDRMKADYPEHVEVVMLRYFVGLTIDETATALEVSKVTVQRRWRFARAWLKNDMNQR